MIKINDCNKKLFYYVSNVKAGTLTIIDGSCNSIIKNIFVGKRPFKLAVMDKNKICVACDRSNSISVVDCLSFNASKIYVPNDGNIEIDRLNKKIFISNTSEINVYDIMAEKIISNIIGFLSITSLKLSHDSSKLYVLDKLLSELRIYSTVNSKLIYSFKNLGINPGYFLIAEDNKTVYISMENNGENINHHDILKLDVYKNKLEPLDLPKGSIIAGMLIKGSILYAANKGLNRIELINIDTYKAYGFILTSMPQPNRICITDDETKLLVTNRNNGGAGSIDIIDSATNHLMSRVLMDSEDSQPFDVVSISIDLPEIDNIPTAITDLMYTKEPLTIITKKVFACYRENIYFSNISISLSKHKYSSYIIEKIKFEKGVIVNGSEVRTDIAEMPGFSRIQFLLRITYTIYYLENSENDFSLRGFLEKNQDIIVTIPKERDVKEFELKLKSTTKLINTPSLVDNVVGFKVRTSLEVKIIGEDEISLEPIEEHYETFLGFSGSIFPEGTVLPYLDELDE